MKENRDQPKDNHKNNSKMKNGRKIKAMGNIPFIMNHYPRNGQMGDSDP